MRIKCKCGTIIVIKTPSRIGRTKYCSKSCFYKYRTRPQGLRYKIVKDNPTWFKKGFTPWSKGVELGSKSHKWKGDHVGYSALHKWVKRRMGKADKCILCNSKLDVQWANKSYQYQRDVKDWMKLCRLCHVRRDRKYGRSAAMVLFKGKLN